ncbi:MAG: hypothetical protein JNL68_02170 [Burkholderiales bacterium]|nr:hypothetical protein [Burkholderiales bacterium]
MRLPRPFEASGAWDRLAQAALVRRQVEGLGEPLCWLALALYSRSQARGPAALALIEHLNPTPEAREATALMLAQYVGMSRGRGGIDHVRRLLGIRKSSALEQRRELFRRLDGLLLRVHAALGPKLIAGGLVQTHDSRTETTMSKLPIDDVLDSLLAIDADLEKAGEKFAVVQIHNRNGAALCTAVSTLMNECLALAQSEPVTEITTLQRDATGKPYRALKHRGKARAEDCTRALSGFLSAVIALAVQQEAARHGG